jgi:hypothetical protein
LLRPIAMAVAAIGAMETSLPPGEHVCNASMAGLKAFANVTSIAIRNLGSIAPFELTPVGSSRLAAAASFGRLETAIGVQASMQGPFGFNQRASFVCHANLSDVRATITWRVATLASQAQEALQGMAASDGLPHGIARAAAALRTGDVALQEANVSVNGAIALSFAGADGSGPPPLLWKILSRALSSVLKAVIEELATAALNEALVSVASGVAVAPRGEQASAGNGEPREPEGVAADEVSPETADSATHVQRDTGHDTYFYVNAYPGARGHPPKAPTLNRSRLRLGYRPLPLRHRAGARTPWGTPWPVDRACPPAGPRAPPRARPRAPGRRARPRGAFGSAPTPRPDGGAAATGCPGVPRVYRVAHTTGQGAVHHRVYLSR